MDKTDKTFEEQVLGIEHELDMSVQPEPLTNEQVGKIMEKNK